MTTTKPLTKYARYVTEAVCARRQVPIEAVMGRNRNKWVSWARFEIWSILVRTPDMPLLSTYAAKNVGRMFGRDHSSVMNGVRRFRGLEMIPSKRDRRPRLPDPDPPPARLLPAARTAQAATDAGAQAGGAHPHHPPTDPRLHDQGGSPCLPCEMRKGAPPASSTHWC